MPDFSLRYRHAFSALGRQLRSKDRTTLSEIRAAEKRLGSSTPKALRDYYRLAGRAVDYNSAHDRLLPPSEWSVEGRRLVFMEENQAVVLYGTVASDDPADDPAAFMCSNEEPYRWTKENSHCSVFLMVMLHWEAAFGGAMPEGGTAKVSPRLRRTLDKTWRFVGEVNRMRAYQKRGRALCILRWGPEWRVFAGAVSEANFSAIECELGLVWDG